MSYTLALVIYAGGIAAAALIYRLLRRTTSPGVAFGVGFWVATLAFHPLRQAGDGRIGFAAWAVWAAICAVAVACLYSVLRRSAGKL
jgi:hypothetical protein